MKKRLEKVRITLPTLNPEGQFLELIQNCFTCNICSKVLATLAPVLSIKILDRDINPIR